MDEPVGQQQNYVFTFTPSSAFDPTNVELSFQCDDTDPAPVIPGLNTLLLSASNTPVPDIVAFSATVNGDGYVDLASAQGTFAVATVNLGAGAEITVTADTGGVPLALEWSICEIDPAIPINCLGPDATSVTTTISANATAGFFIFLHASSPRFDPIANDPANNRIFVRFQDGDGVMRGSTSVAVTTRRL